MVVKKNITVEEVHESGETKVVYKGEDKRFYNTNYQQGFLGVPIGDWIKIALTIFGIAIFVVKDNIRINALEEGQHRLTEISTSMQQYMEASDGFNSSIFGTQFKGGRPIDGAFKNRGNTTGKDNQ